MSVLIIVFLTAVAALFSGVFEQGKFARYIGIFGLIIALYVSFYRKLHSSSSTDICMITVPIPHCLQKYLSSQHCYFSSWEVLHSAITEVTSQNCMP